MPEALWQELQNDFDRARQWLTEQTADSEMPPVSWTEPDAIDPKTLAQVIERLSQGEIPEPAIDQLKPGLPTEIADAMNEALDDFEPEKAAKILMTFRNTLEASQC